MDTPEKTPKIKKKETKLEDKSKRSSEEIARMIHPHDDKPDPTAHTGNYNFPQLLFAFLLGFTAMFLLSIDEIQDFKGCSSSEYITDLEKK